MLAIKDTKLSVDTKCAKKAALNDYRRNLKDELNEFVDRIVANGQKHDYYLL